MDSLRKKPISAPKPIARPRQTIIQPSPTYSFPKKDELYISKEETLQENLDEKKIRRGKILRKIFWSVLFFIFLLFAACGIFFAWKAYGVSKKINDTHAKQTTLAQDVKSLITPSASDNNIQTLQGQDSGRINILLLGAAGARNPGGNLTDTVMVMSIDTKNRKVALLSLPRDLYVQIPASTRENDRSLASIQQDASLSRSGSTRGGPDTQTFTKINSLYKISLDQQRGTDLTKQAVEKITGLPINYYLVVDFDAFEKIVDDIGGVNIYSERDIFDPTYPGPNYSYQTFSLSRGQHLLDGKTALQYVRERHDDPEGDFGRAKRQQQMIQAVKNKLFSAQTLFNVVALSNVLDTLGDNIKTDMEFGDLEQFIKLSKTVDTQNINNVVVDAWKPDSLLKVSHVTVGDVQMFILVPRVGNYSEIQDLAQNIFSQDELRKRHEEILKEDASIEIVNHSDDRQLATKIKKLLAEKLGLKNVRIVLDTDKETRDQTTVSNNDTKLYTIDELIKKLPATLTDTQSDSSDDIIVTLGNDLVDVYKYEENTMDDLNKNADNQENISLTDNF